MTDQEQRLREYLDSKGLKFTPERKTILDKVFADHNHFEAEDLLINLRRAGQRVSKATIYRTLALLVESGLLREVITDEKHAHYEHVYGHAHHDHLVCINCGKIIEFTNESIESLQEEVCEQHNFTPTSHRMQISGHCEDCVKRKKDWPEISA